jgi:hypothetical protein
MDKARFNRMSTAALVKAVGHEVTQSRHHNHTAADAVGGHPRDRLAVAAIRGESIYPEESSFGYSSKQPYCWPVSGSARHRHCD